jgi:cytochrome P450
MMEKAEPNFFSDPAVIQDPKSYFELMRAKCPVAKEQYHGVLMVTGYDEVMEVNNRKDDTFSSAVSVIGPIPPLPFVPEGDDISEQLEAHRHEIPWSAHLTCFDGDKHSQYRALIFSLLTFSRIKQNEEYLYGLIDRLIDRFIDKGYCNVVPEFAHATTTYAISDLLGIPEADRAELLELIGAPPSQIAGDAPHKVGPDPLIFMKERFDQYIKQRQANPGTDLMSELAAAQLRDGTKPDLDMLSCLARFVFGAGQDTTSRLIAMGIQKLGETPGLQTRLRRAPQDIPAFIEELLRSDPPVKVAYRIARRRTTIGAVDVPAGTIVALCLTGASNDPKHFENPENFDIDRPRARTHMAFNRGPHACLGAPLARLESRIAIERILARTKEIRISEEHHGPPNARQYRYEPTYSFRNLTELHIEFTRA